MHNDMLAPTCLILVIGMLSACGNKGDLYLTADSQLEREIDEVTGSISDPGAPDDPTLLKPAVVKDNDDTDPQTGKASQRSP